MQNQTGEILERLTSQFSNIADRTQNVLETVDRSAIQTQEQLNIVKTQAINSIANVTQNAKDILTKTLNETGDRAVEKLLKTTDNVRETLEQTIQKAETVTNSLNNEIQAGTNAVITNWLNQHPIIAWILEHPLLTLILIIFSLVLVLGAIKAVFQAIEKLGGRLINSPLMAVTFLWGLKKKKTETAMTLQHEPTLDFSFNTSLSEENLSQIVQKLETLEKTQHQILQQLTVLQKISK